MRGYGAKDGVSDEAELYKEVLGEEHVYVNPSRIDSLKKAEEHAYDLILMDDAFQHRKVFRDLDLVLSDASNFVLDDGLMPLGTLREPVSGLKRAHGLMLTRCESVDENALQLKKDRVKTLFPHLYLGEAKTQMSQLTALNQDLRWNEDYKVYLFSGIGDPEKFRASVKGQGIEIVGECIFRDHHFISDNEMQTMEQEAASCGADVFLTTAKDAVKLKTQMDRPIFVLQIELEVKQGQAFFNWVRGL